MLEVFVMLKLNQKSSIHEETEAHIVLMEENEIVVDPNLLKSIAGKLDTLGKPNEADNFTIFPVPYKFRQSKENLFEPSVVSIGPFHRGKTSVQTMEEQKLRFLRDFLSRGDHISLNLCLSEIKKLEKRTRMCYSESVPLDSNSFVEMMLLDGCFVLEYFLEWYERRLNSIGSVFVLSDLLLLENQIPFFIVKMLFGLIPDARSIGDFKNYLVNVFARVGPAVLDDSIVPNPPAEIHHFIHLCYHCSIPINLSKPDVIIISSVSFHPSMLSTINHFIPCASKLQIGGIQLRRKRNPCHMLDISFEDCVLEIPRLKITNESKTLLANLIAFEQYKSDKLSANLSSFALFLYSLVKTPEDVKILQKCGIIDNYLDSDEELIDFFNQICKGMVVENNHLLAKLFLEVNKYCESDMSKLKSIWNTRKKRLEKDYFSDPWTVISIFGSVFVAIMLSLVQTIYTVYAYYYPPS